MGQKSKAGGAQGVKEKGKAKNGFLRAQAWAEFLTRPGVRGDSLRDQA